MRSTCLILICVLFIQALSAQEKNHATEIDVAVAPGRLTGDLEGRFRGVSVGMKWRFLRVQADFNDLQLPEQHYWAGKMSPGVRTFSLSAGLDYELERFRFSLLGGAFYGNSDRYWHLPGMISNSSANESIRLNQVPEYLVTQRYTTQGIHGMVLNASLGYRITEHWQVGVAVTSYQYIIGRRMSYREPIRSEQLFLRYSIPGSGEKLGNIPIFTALYGGVVLNETDGWWTTAQATLRFKNVLVAADVDLMRHDPMNTSYYKSYDYAGSFNGAALSLGYALDVQRFTFGLTAGYFYGFGRMKQSRALNDNVVRTVYYDEDVFGLRARFMVDYRVTDRWSAGVSAVANAITTHQPMFIASAQLPTPAAIQIGVKHNWGKLNHSSVEKQPTP